MALLTSMVSHWRLNEASGNALDAFGSNTLTDNNTVAAATGKISGARDFESGNSESFSIADNASLSFADEHLTIGAWVQLESKGADRVIVGKMSGTPLAEYLLRYQNSSDRFQMQVSHNGTVAANATANNFGSPSLATWYYVMGGHNPDTNEVWISVNAGTRNTTAHTLGILDGSGTFAIGKEGTRNVDFWDGLIDEVSLWRRSLSTGENARIYNNGNGLSFPFTDSNLLLLGVG